MHLVIELEVNLSKEAGIAQLEIASINIEIEFYCVLMYFKYKNFIQICDSALINVNCKICFNVRHSTNRNLDLTLNSIRYYHSNNIFQHSFTKEKFVKHFLIVNFNLLFY